MFLDHAVQWTGHMRSVRPRLGPSQLASRLPARGRRLLRRRQCVDVDSPMGLFSDPVGHTDAFCMNPNRVFKRNTIFFCLLFFPTGPRARRESPPGPRSPRGGRAARPGRQLRRRRRAQEPGPRPSRRALRCRGSCLCRAVCVQSADCSLAAVRCVDRARAEPRDEAPTGVKSHRTGSRRPSLCVSLCVSLSSRAGYTRRVSASDRRSHKPSLT